jgi:hypothetical protein
MLKLQDYLSPLAGCKKLLYTEWCSDKNKKDFYLKEMSGIQTY